MERFTTFLTAVAFHLQSTKSRAVLTGYSSTSTDLSTSSSTNGATTTYNYTANAPSCNNAFVTSISEPLSLSRSITWNCTGGVLLSLTDENSKIASASYTDPYFWRPASTTDQASNVTSFSYLSPTRTETAMTFNGGISVVDHLIQLDGLGRLIVSQTRQAPGSSNYDSVEKEGGAGKHTERSLYGNCGR